MRSAIVMRRPGLVTVSGYVKEVLDEEIVLENTFQGQSMEVHLMRQPDTKTWLKLTKGSAIVATTSDDFSIEMMLEGGCVSSGKIVLGCKNMRFNGAFDFSKHNDQKEQHVFAGTLLSAQSGEKNGVSWESGTIGWKKNGQPETRTIFRWRPTGTPLSDFIGKRIIAVTDEKHVTSDKREWYTLKTVYNL